MNWRLYAILSVFIFITVGRIEAQKKYDKALQKADKQYNAGNYAKALSALNSFRASVTSGLGASNPYMVKYHIRDARFNLAYGMVNNLDQRLNNAIDVSKAVYGENTLEHANTLVEVGEIYNQYGYFRLSNEVLSQVTRVVMTADKNHDALRSKYILAMAEAQIGQGYYDRGIALLRSNEEFIAGRATTKEVSAESGKLVTRQVPAAELLERYTGYARMLSLTTLAYGKKGDIDSMDISHSLSRPWLTKNLKTLEEKDIALILVQADYIYTRMYAENNDGDVPPMLPKYADYGTQLAELKKTGVAPSIPLAHDIYLSLINQRQREDNKSGYVNTKAEYERMLNKYFKKESVLFINLKSIEFDSRVQKDRITNIESDALSTITSKSLPRNHPTTLRILDFMYAASVQGRR
ncbi:MAG: hypothetical protein MUE95_15385, partial [Cyclobacteriaceae bacterium]|nr:hypothetical protein [Cyclobacteriaceae bacterium]